MVWELVIGFVVLVAASYVGTTMALRGFFGREYYDQSADSRPGGGDFRREGAGREESDPEGSGREGSGREGSGAETPSEEETQSETGSRPDEE